MGRQASGKISHTWHLYVNSSHDGSPPLKECPGYYVVSKDDDACEVRSRILSDGARMMTGTRDDSLGCGP
jgi:hypothetical protein